MTKSEENDFEEDKRFKKQAMKKKGNDPSFDSFYNFALEDITFKSLSRNVVFLLAEERLHHLYIYYQYSKRYFKYYMEEAKKEADKAKEEMLEDLKDSSKDFPFGEAEVDLTYGEDIHSMEEVGKLTNQSIILMLYSFYEKFLHSLIIMLADDEETLLKPKDKDDLPRQYMIHLKNAGIFIPRKLFYQFDMLRLIRNYICHTDTSSPYVISDKLVNYLNQYGWTTLIDNNEIYPDNKFVEFAFRLISDLIKAIENSYMELYQY